MLASTSCDCINESKNNTQRKGNLTHNLEFPLPPSMISGSDIVWHRLFLNSFCDTQTEHRETKQVCALCGIVLCSVADLSCENSLLFNLSSVLFDLVFVLLDFVMDHFQRSEKVSQEQDEKGQGQHEHLQFIKNCQSNEQMKCNSLLKHTHTNKSGKTSLFLFLPATLCSLPGQTD